jgi:hypothetical protein
MALLYKLVFDLHMVSATRRAAPGATEWFLGFGFGSAARFSEREKQDDPNAT